MSYPYHRAATGEVRSPAADRPSDGHARLSIHIDLTVAADDAPVLGARPGCLLRLHEGPDDVVTSVVVEARPASAL
jgi:hypothetical protein